jgi:UDP-N-acetylmuramoylalanine--D-glutamate ligase
VTVGEPRAVVVGLRVVGAAVTRALQRRGYEVVATDDRPTDATRGSAADLGIELAEGPDAARLAALVSGAELVALSPGIPEGHPVHHAAAEAGVPLRSEYDLAAEWDDRPCLAVTGTDGKTTVTSLVEQMLLESGRRPMVAGNADVPLVEAIDDPGPEMFVVEASSFGLGVSTEFRPRVATWLNFAPDHQDVHDSLASYEAAKARIWRNLGPGDRPVANADDPVVRRNASGLANLVTFSLHGDADWWRLGNELLAPGGSPFLSIADLPRAFPHDIANVLAAAATAVTGGATVEGAARAARSFRGLPHRVTLVGEAGGVRFYDDSKATAPHATLAAVGAFDSVVLVAGGRNKGLDLSVLAEATPHVRAVVAIGEAAPDVAAAFAGKRPVVTAASMDEAVTAASELAAPGDAVVLSPGCASFDWYGSYGERGDDFIRAVGQLARQGGAPT